MWCLRVGCVVASALCATATAAAPAPRAPASALSLPGFTAAPTALLAAAAAAPAGDWPAVVLRDQRDVSYDGQGRATTRWRVVFVVASPAGADDWGQIGVQWSPFHEHRPVVRARVIDPGGRTLALDPGRITEAAVAGDAAGRRVLEARLPRLAVGAVVEQEIVMVDREPLFPAGICDLYPLGRDVPTLTTVVSYATTGGRPLYFTERQLPPGSHPQHASERGRDRWVYELGALPAQAPAEPGLPADEVVAPYIGVSTAASWDVIARAYHAVVERRIAGGPIRLPAALPHAASLEAVAAITAWLHHRVRYTAVELGAASLIPRPPAETVRRGTGDCKDQAVLLIALLRQAHIEADLVLLDAGGGRDVDPDLPGMGQFDHAIVRARVGATEVWIDPTEELARPGQLPARDQGRRALIVARDSRGLITTPSATTADNLVREVRTFVAAAQGPSRLTETTRATGVFEAEQRARARGLGPDGLAQAAASHAADEYEGTAAGVTTSDPADLATPFEETVVIDAATHVVTTADQLEISLLPRSVLARLPVALTVAPGAPRRHDFVWQRPHVYEIENRIVIPAGFVLRRAPADRAVALGPATFSERHRVDGPAPDAARAPGAASQTLVVTPQTLVVTFRFDSGKPRITPAELTALAAAARALSDETVQITLHRARP